MATKVASSSSSVAITVAFAAGRTTQACDVCANRSALWHCAADEAYLCTACDTQVHSANAVSNRHERVRLSPTGTAKTSFASALLPEDAPVSSRKRSRGTSKPYSHHLRKLTRLSNQLVSRDVKVEEKNNSANNSSVVVVQAELELFDFLDADEFLINDGNQEVPSLSPIKSGSPCCSSDLDQFVFSDQEGDIHSAKNSADSFAAFFKGKAAHSQHVISDQFLVPEGSLDHFRELDCIDIGTATAPADTDIDLAAAAGDAFFFPGDIPGLESFVPEMVLVDDFSLSFDLALQNGLDAFEGNVNVGAATSESTGVVTSQECKTKPAETTTPYHSDFLAGPFAKFFAQKSKTDSQSEEPMGLERIKREAREMLQCCREGDQDDKSAAQKNSNTLVPSLQLNLKDVLASWSDREEPWILGSIHDDSTSSGSDDVGLVPEMDGPDRDARVLRYKEKRRNRLFSKTIRYEVRKVNAERRPRMKGRFVKRSTTATISSS